VDDGFEGFYTASYRRLLKQVVLVTGELAEAEDVLQEAYARAALRWRRLADYQAPEAWVRRVAMNLATDSLRRGRRRMAAMLRVGPPAPAAELSADSLDLANALRSISPTQRQAIVLHHVVGLPVDEVAAQLRAPVGTVKTRLARGRAKLARQLEAGRRMEVLRDG
jgi:RNA polymerase sigma-70 factor, ECF subfamily